MKIFSRDIRHSHRAIIVSPAEGAILTAVFAAVAYAAANFASAPTLLSLALGIIVAGLSAYGVATSSATQAAAQARAQALAEARASPSAIPLK
jgi:hypothetical protein